MICDLEDEFMKNNEIVINHKILMEKSDFWTVAFLYEHPTSVKNC